ncbi:MAG: Asp-tRNA(Asn)/Glu-tRNA(Gln) amidotransferase subunit GatA [Mucispirillum sp.]|nr:Asp-tRNA(Asn)/Glu-tRNA(Gln) amidotransferase subunit GatA [Mucispirillum sp.]
MSNDLTSLSVTELSAGFDRKEFSATDVTKAYIKKMESGKIYNAYITETPETALKQADICDKRIAAGGRLSLLDGVPLGIKDLFCTENIRTTAASKILENFIPPYESTVTRKLLDAGSVFLGKTNLDEFAMGGTNLTSYFGETVNPHIRKDGAKVVTGGSSGGSAAAVAANMCAAATGTDTGGSIRQPSSYCGIVGIKPTYGRCSRYGIIAYASSLDQAGPMTKTVEDAAIMLYYMSGFDEKDSTSANIAVPDFKAAVTKGVKGLKIGMPKELLKENLNEEIRNAWLEGKAILEEAGAAVTEISLPNMQYALAAYYIIAPAEASSNLARYDGVRFGLRVEGGSLDEMYENTRSAGFGAEVKRRIMIGTYALSAGYYDAYYLKALDVRRLIRRDYDEAFKQVDAILTPTAPTTAFTIEESRAFDPVTSYLQDAFTVPANLAKLPGISVPVSVSSNNLPIGLQLIGRDFDEETLFKCAYALERK